MTNNDASRTVSGAMTSSAGGTRNPNELVTLLEAARELGLSKKTLAGYVHDEDDPLPSTRDAMGVYYVRRGDIEAYLAEHPARGRSWKAEPDRRPSNDDQPDKQYFTLSDAAQAAGCSVSTVRAMTRKATNPLPTTKNKDGYVLVEQGAFWNYFEMLYGSEGRFPNCDKSNTPETIAFGGYPELADLPGTYQQPKAIAEALGLPSELVRSWTRGPDAVEHVQVGRRVFINKHKLPAFLERQESRPDRYGFALSG